MKFINSVFKAYDIRGLVGTEITEELALAVGRSLADLLGNHGPVAVGHDMRPDSAVLAQRLREGIISQGREVWDIGLVTSDMIYFAVGHYGLAGGAMITASHNPGQYNGIKLCREEAAPIGETTGLDRIKVALANDDFEESPRHGTIIERNIVTDWIDHSLSFVDVSKWPAYKVGIDAGNGMAGAIIPSLEPKVPLRISPLYFELDGTFPNHPASPIEPKNLRDLVALIERDKLDFGIAFDGDGDRAFLVDELGQPVTGSVMAAIIAEAMLVKYPGATILYNAVCSRVVKETIEAHGGTAIRTRVGHSFIKTDMRTDRAVFAGEHSGHFYFKDNYFADSGLIAALVAIDVLAKSGLKLSQLADKYRRYYESGEINVEVKDKAAKLDELAARYSDGTQDLLDGLTVNYADWWLNCRPSNTEPYLRLNVEATSPELLKIKLDETLTLIKN
jgi:phosphomannomutase